MQIPHKKLAFFVALIGLVAIIGLIISGHITNEQAGIVLPSLLILCGYFMGLDAIYDYLSIIFRVAEFVTSLTPDTEDDKRVVDLRANVERIIGKNANVIDPALKERIEEAVG